MYSFVVRGLLGVVLSTALVTNPVANMSDDEPPSIELPAAVAVAEAPTIADPFEGYPLLKKICECESGLTHYINEEKQVVLRGRVNRYDIGICQINEQYHRESIARTGYNIYTPEGNIRFAKLLYNKQGSKPWVWSKGCWGK